MVSPRKSRRKSACFSSTTTETPARARRKPSIMPAGPPPAIAQRNDRVSALAVILGPRAGVPWLRDQGEPVAPRVAGPSGRATRRTSRQSTSLRGEKSNRLTMIASTADDVPTAWRIPPAAAVALRTGAADVHGPSLEFGTIQALNGRHRVRLPRHLDEAQALRSPIRIIHHDVHGPQRPVGCECLTEIALRH